MNPITWNSGNACTVKKREVEGRKVLFLPIIFLKVQRLKWLKNFGYLVWNIWKMLRGWEEKVEYRSIL